MGHTAIGLIAGALLQVSAAAPEDLAQRWLVMGRTHATKERAEAHAAAMRERQTPVFVLSTDHYANMVPGRFAIVFFAVTDKAEARRRQRGIWNLGHRPWIRWSGAYVDHPTKKSLRLRKRRLAPTAPPSEVGKRAGEGRQLPSQPVDRRFRPAGSECRDRAWTREIGRTVKTKSATVLQTVSSRREAGWRVSAWSRRRRGGRG